MKGALACYVEAVRALQDAGRAAARRRADRRRLRRDREDAVRRRDRARSTAATPPARATSSRTAASPTCACSASRPRARSCSATSARSGCASACTATSSTPRSARASATRTRSCACTRCSTRCWSGSRRWEDDPANAYRGAKAIVNVGAIEGGFGWRVSRTPHHTDLFLDVRVPPTKPMGVARREVLDLVRLARRALPRLRRRGRGLRHRARAPRSRRGTSSSRRSTRRTSRSSARSPGRDVTRWFSDASALTRYGIPTVNYGTSTGLMDVELGENLDIDGLVKTAETYALVAHGGLRRRMTFDVYSLPPDLPVPEDDGAADHLDRARAAGPRARVVAGRRQRPRLRRDLRLPALRPAGRAAAARLGRDAGRARLHAAVVRVPRRLRGLRRPGRRALRAERSTTSSSSPSGTGCRSR